MSYTFDQMKAFQVGQKYYECGYGQNLEFEVTEVPTVSTTTMPKTSDKADGEFQVEQLRWKAKRTKKEDEVVDFLVTQNFMHYGPRLYEGPQYGSFKDGEFNFRID